ncbi:hypothetical protein PF005_g9254 [Phytophthora fragariae]|uniref:Uncharacterized protein n=2 Tax=Phytophthora TaxID=4783 RepID=A0A6A3FJD5_9STRA|nr:hypothetical protein PF003_g25138 [Phytophthora fragariae]KAE9005984.1 hypothetical protein PR002_g16611 [Phytophthora rubi]KAE8945895.1 hypothetical protein PF009_g4467 [Phytophthora fragariae]KAE9000192.1 hypothetical protein PF011_g14290 [Phytophthora fragariae]KAE9010143.1 hypothetical protein PR001_g16255 [Phytophthora rubi]
MWNFKSLQCRSYDHDNKQRSVDAIASPVDSQKLSDSDEKKNRETIQRVEV